MKPSRPDGALPAQSRPGCAASVESTTDLLLRFRAGDEAALGALMSRCVPRLLRWASGRLPRHARDLLDTQDLVQETVVQVLRRLDLFEPRHEGALQAYLRQAVLNRIRDELRRAGRRPALVELGDGQPDPGASPLEHAMGREALDRYEAGLAGLREADRAAVVARFELQYSYQELAQALGKPSPDAARVAVTRALRRLVEAMNHGP
jgi:RNA polymerase sigma-70 factor (ECF subfamily)